MPAKKQNKKVLFKVSGSFKIGWGHISRSRTLANAVSAKTGPKNIIFFCDCPDKELNGTLRPYKTIFNHSQAGQIVEVVRHEPIDALVLDEMDENRELCRILKKEFPRLKIVGLDYFNYENKDMDVRVNLFNHNRSVKDPAKKVTGKYVQGLKYAIVRDAFRSYAQKKKRINKKVTNILISFGGADMSSNTIKALRLLAEAGYQDSAEIIMGPLFQESKKTAIRDFIKRAPFKAHVHEAVADLEKYLFKADLVFIGSGTTLMECCSVGTPAIVIPQNKREHDFAKYFESQEAIVVIDVKKSGVTLISRLINDPKARAAMSRNQKKLIDGKGKERIREIILAD